MNASEVCAFGRRFRLRSSLVPYECREALQESALSYRTYCKPNWDNREADLRDKSRI